MKDSGRRILSHKYDEIISLENLCLAWEEFIISKKKKLDVIKFSKNLMDNIVDLHFDLVNHTYCHGRYESFFINDPKRRHIHKASVRDRLVHHAVYRVLYPFFDRVYIADSYSCRDDKGTHKAVEKFGKYIRKASKNNHRVCWVLKCDIKKFFASIDHEVLLCILQKYILDKNIINLLKNIVESFCTDENRNIGLPLGNLTSQLFSNVYMDVFDQWVKHDLKVKYYIRYADDFVFISDYKKYLESIVAKIQEFLQNNLKLSLHPDKFFLKTISSGVDFLGWVNFSDHRVLRTKTRQRMFKKIQKENSEESLQSYLGLLSHGNAFKTRKKLEFWGWLWA